MRLQPQWCRKCDVTIPSLYGQACSTILLSVLPTRPMQLGGASFAHVKRGAHLSAVLTSPHRSSSTAFCAEVPWLGDRRHRDNCCREGRCRYQCRMSILTTCAMPQDAAHTLPGPSQHNNDSCSRQNAYKLRFADCRSGSNRPGCS